MTPDHIVGVLKQRVATTLTGTDSAVVPASTLTDFPWQQLCFRRDEALQLVFRQGEAETVVPLDYNEFFVDEAHVPGSLDGECLAYGDTVLVRRKYPHDTGPFEFMKADVVVAP